MSIRHLLSTLAASLISGLVMSLLVIQPAFASSKKACFTGYSRVSQFAWNEDHCEMSPSVGVRIKGKGGFTLYLSTNIDNEVNVVHEQVINGPMDYWIHLHDFPIGSDGESIILEWTIMDKKGKMKDFFIMGPFDCNAL